MSMTQITEYLSNVPVEYIIGTTALVAGTAGMALRSIFSGGKRRSAELRVKEKGLAVKLKESEVALAKESNAVNLRKLGNDASELQYAHELEVQNRDYEAKKDSDKVAHQNRLEIEDKNKVLRAGERTQLFVSYSS